MFTGNYRQERNTDCHGISEKQNSSIRKIKKDFTEVGFMVGPQKRKGLKK